MEVRAINRLLDPIKRSIKNIALRGVVTSHNGPDMVVDTVDGAQKAKCHQQFGTGSRCLEGAEVTMVAARGHRGHMVVVSTRDRRYEIPLEPGESILFDAFGNKTHLQELGITIKSTTGFIKAETPDNTFHLSEAGTSMKSTVAVVIESPDNTIKGDTKVEGTLTATVNVIAAGVGLIDHPHDETQHAAAGNYSGAPVATY